MTSIKRASRTVRQVQSLGGRAAFFRADVRVEAEVKKLISFAVTTFQGISVLVNNASAPHANAGIENWRNAIETDLLGAVYATRWAIEAMRRGKGGAIVNIASISALWHGRKTPGGLPGYDVAKAGMIRMTTRLASLAETDGIRVNCLAPGWIATDEVRHYWESLTPSQRLQQGITRIKSRMLPSSWPTINRWQAVSSSGGPKMVLASSSGATEGGKATCTASHCILLVSHFHTTGLFGSWPT